MTGYRPRIAVVDVGLGNLFSVIQALVHCGADAWRTNDADEIAAADGVVLPGVGAFGDAMRALLDRGIDGALRDLVDRRIPVLGICLGMQLLLERSAEFGNHRGLGLLAGEVLPLKAVVAKGTKVPNMGWGACQLTAEGERHPVLSCMPNGGKMYFVHSYYVSPAQESEILAVTGYGGAEFCAGIGRDRLTGVQFHPEKSADEGLALYRRFSASCVGSRSGSGIAHSPHVVQ
jgi:glutamine amidotransferase